MWTANHMEPAIDIIRRFCQQPEVELVGGWKIAGLGEDLGQHSSDGWILRMRCVELLEERQSVSIVLCGEHGGELRVERGVVGLLLKRCADKLLCFGEFLLAD